jgi:hypothetical protein
LEVLTSASGECRVPQSWQVLYRTIEDEFKPVTNPGPYGIEKDGFNPVSFEPIATDAIKIEIKLQDQWSAGLQEVVIE